MTPLVEEMFLNNTIIGDVILGLVKKKISQSVVNETVIIELHCFGNMALTAIDDHRASISQASKIADGRDCAVRRSSSWYWKVTIGRYPSLRRRVTSSDIQPKSSQGAAPLLSSVAQAT